MRETSELESEDIQMGKSLKRLLKDIAPQQIERLDKISPCCYVTGFSYACVLWQVSVKDAQIAFAFSWLENQIAAAIKLIPLGQTAGQRLLSALLSTIDEAVNQSEKLEDEDIGSSLPALTLASSLHETQYSRLFRS